MSAITVRLLRAVGAVSENTIVDFVALDATGQRVGVFSNVELSKGGVASANYFPGKRPPHRGVVTIPAQPSPEVPRSAPPNLRDSSIR